MRDKILCKDCKTMTNFERIKKMDIEEMAKLLCNDVIGRNGECHLDMSCHFTMGDCKKCIKIWLESEVKK